MWLGLARPQWRSSDTDTLYSLSFCCGAGIPVFLDLPDTAKTSSIRRCRTGLLACATEASRLKLRQHMPEALVCRWGWWRGRACFVLASFRTFYSTSHCVCSGMCRNIGLALWTSFVRCLRQDSKFWKWITLKFIFKLQIQYLHFYIHNKLIYQNTTNLGLWSFGLNFPRILCMEEGLLCKLKYYKI